MERHFKSDALVLRNRPLGEADRLVTLLTWERGKLVAVARGARKTKSKLAAGTDLFTFGSYMFYQARSLPLITGQEVKESFPPFREQPLFYLRALYLAELLDRLTADNDPCPNACELLLEGWRLLAGPAAPDGNVFIRAFELKALDLFGYRPDLSACLGCGSAATALFSPRHGGLLCPRCRHKDGQCLPFAPGTAALARRLLETPLSLVKNLRPLAGQKEELAALTSSLFRYHLELGESEVLRSMRVMENSLRYTAPPGEAAKEAKPEQ